MPGTIVGLIIVALVALPGLVYHSATSRRRPGESFASYSPRIVASGLAFLLVTLATIALIGDYWTDVPLTGPADLAQGTSDYLADHTRRLIWTGLLVLGVSVSLAWLVGRQAGKLRLLRPDRPYYEGTDPWWIVLKEEPESEGPAYAYVELRDGGSAGGLVIWFSAQSGAYGDRDLVLMPWVEGVDALWRHGPVSKAKLRQLFLHPNPQHVDVSLRTVIPGDQIARLHVRYLWESGAAALIGALRRWSKANAPDRLLVQDTMSYSIVSVDGAQRMRIYRKTGTVHIHLDASGPDQAENVLTSLNATRLRGHRNAYELPASELLDGDQMHPAFLQKILQPLISNSADSAPTPS